MDTPKEIAQDVINAPAYADFTAKDVHPLALEYLQMRSYLERRMAGGRSDKTALEHFLSVKDDTRYVTV
jgi:hypothetical protein